MVKVDKYHTIIDAEAGIQAFTNDTNTSSPVPFGLRFLSHAAAVSGIVDGIPHIKSRHSVGI